MTTSRQIATGDVANLLFEHPGYIAGRWYLPFGHHIYTTGSNGGIGSARLYPGYIKELVTLSALGCRTATGSAGNVQAAIYAHNPSTGRPTGAALCSTASMSTTSGATSLSSAVSVQLGPGLYWFATNVDNSGCNFASAAVSDSFMSMLIGTATQGNGLLAANAMMGVSTPLSFGTWSDLSAAVFTEVLSASFPGVQFQIASVP